MTDTNGNQIYTCYLNEDGTQADDLDSCDGGDIYSCQVYTSYYGD